MSAGWADGHWEKAVRLVASLLEPRLDPQEKVLIARIAVIPSSDPNMQLLPVSLDSIVPADNKTISVELLGSDIRKAFIFKAKHPPMVQAATAEHAMNAVVA